MIVLSTDDEEIAQEGRRAGLDVPSLRPQELATDLASGYAVWRHALLDAEARSGRQFDLAVLAQPTSPFRRPSDVTACLSRLVDSRLDAVVTVSPTPAHFTPEKTMVVADDGLLQPYLTAERFQPTRQLIPSYYNLNGICYAARRDIVIERTHVFDDKTGAVVIDRPTVNIDDPLDLELARWLWERQ